MDSRCKPGALSVLVSLLALSGCDSVHDLPGLLEAEHHEAHAEGHGHGHGGTFPVVSPLRMDTELVDDYVCQIRAIRHIELRALERGYLEEIFIDEGRHVTKGQPMFEVMKMVYEAELNMAKAEAEAARIEFENTKLLEGKGVVSENELLLAQARLEKAKAEVELHAAHLRLTSIKAPFDGIMGLLEVRQGSLLEEGELLTTLSDNSQMWVYFNVTETEYLHFRSLGEGGGPAQVQLVMANGELFDEPGLVETTAADFNNETGTIMFRATFPNPEGLLRHGQTGNVRVTTPLKDALIIPQKATFEILDGQYVFVVNDEGVIQQRRITIAAEMPHRYVISDGLSEDDHILLEGLRRVQNGSKIEMAVQDAAEVLAHLELPAD